MPKVRITFNLRRFFPDTEELLVTSKVVREIVAEINLIAPGIRDYLLDDRGALRKHVNIFIGEKPVVDRTRLSDVVPDSAEVSIIQALSGG